MRSIATILFGLSFSLVASNAILYQSEKHPAPIWVSQKNGSEVPVNKPVELAIAPGESSDYIITQSISLERIPVPIAKPINPRTFAAQSSLVREVQASLKDVGIYKGHVDGIYGDETRRAIQEFQEKAGIIPDGEASYGLLARIKSVFAVAQAQTRIDQNSSREIQPELIVLDHTMVSRVQSGLRDIYGDEKISVDGIFGNQTREALKRFQKRFEIPLTGELDEATLSKLRDVGVLNSI
ncbi:MAG: peptidoglycan-binding protein [Pseudomonadota bacterium]